MIDNDSNEIIGGGVERDAGRDEKQLLWPLEFHLYRGQKYL